MYPTRRRAAIPPPRFLGGFEATEKILKNQLNIDRQINEHRSKIDQKWSKQPSKNGRKSGQDGSKRRSCWLLAVKRPQHAPKTPQDIPMKAFWRRPGGLEAVLGGKRCPRWPQVGAQNGSKIRLGVSWRRLGSLLEASCSRFYAFLMHFWCMP